MSIVFDSRSTTGSALTVLLLGALLCALPAPSSAAKLYKWVDEKGNVRYSDRLPAEQSGSAHQQLNSQGVVLTTRDAAKTPEELSAEAEAKRKQEEEDKETARLKEKQDKEDRVLLLTYTSVEEIEHARESRIEVIESVIRLIRGSIESTQEKLDGLKKSAERNYTSQGKEIPGGLAQKIEHAERKIENRTAQLQNKEFEKARTNARYDRDLERFKTLKSASNN